jgi:hypothetical protein
MKQKPVSSPIIYQTRGKDNFSGYVEDFSGKTCER